MPVKRCANAWRWSVNWTAKERALLIERSQTVIRQGRDILHAWDATWNSAQALDNALQPDRAAQFADALEKYAAGLATATAVLLK